MFSSALVVQAQSLDVDSVSVSGESIDSIPYAPEIQPVVDGRAQVLNTVTLAIGEVKLDLWGVDTINIGDPLFTLNARTALANVIGAEPVRCDVFTTNQVSRPRGQCVNDADLDLGLYMIQQGYVNVDRAAVFNTIFEDAYIKAEMNAQDAGLGVWGIAQSDVSGEGGVEGSVLLILAFVLFLGMVGTFTFLSIVIMRGFRKVMDAQTDNMDMMARERRLREKEREVVAAMLDSELKANKAKIEAYRVVYQEILNGLRDPDKTPRYKTAGDIIQEQPVLSRAVFDRNTDKIDILGRKLASDLVHFYARVKTSPEYVNIEPDMDITEAVSIVKSAIDKAQKLDELTDSLLEALEKSGVLSEVLE